ncbi:MAG: hypothetical protein J6U86_01425, partial [Clostridia bacterium]|nr:hypothetical protein [Clostridia bacterium]
MKTFQFKFWPTRIFYMYLSKQKNLHKSGDFFVYLVHLQGFEPALAPCFSFNLLYLQAQASSNAWRLRGSNLFDVSKDKFFKSVFREKLIYIQELVNEFDNCVNPFSTGKFSLDNLSEYVGKLD